MRSAIATIVVCSIGYIIGWGIIIGAGNALAIIPALETKVWPVIKLTESVNDIYRDKDIFCWGYHLKKMSPGIPIKYEFKMTPDNSPPIPLAVWVANAQHKHNHGLEDHAVGTDWVRYYCADLPAQSVDWEGFTVSGKAFHRRHPLWDSVTTLPDFHVPALINGSSLSLGAHTREGRQIQEPGPSLLLPSSQLSSE